MAWELAIFLCRKRCEKCHWATLNVRCISFMQLPEHCSSFYNSEKHDIVMIETVHQLKNSVKHVMLHPETVCQLKTNVNHVMLLVETAGNVSCYYSKRFTVLFSHYWWQSFMQLHDNVLAPKRCLSQCW
jgi:hypothetical protein